MYYLSAKFGGFSFSRFGFIVRTERKTESQRRINAILMQLPSESHRDACGEQLDLNQTDKELSLLTHV